MQNITEPGEVLGASKAENQEAFVVRDDFLIMLSHEMRTPLNGIMGMLQLALHARNRDSIQEYLGVALESSKHLLLLLEDISDLASNDAHPIEVKAEVFKLESALESTVALFINKAKSRGITLACQFDPALPQSFVGDAGRIRQLVFNILSYVMKSVQQGEVRLFAGPLAAKDTPDRQGLRIVVNSPALNAQAVRDVPGAGTGPQRTAGLGLTIARRLVRLLGGELVLASEQDGLDTLQVLLPLQAWLEDDKGASPPAPVLEDKAVVSPKILVVEDEPINLKTMLLSLQLLGCKAVGADSAYKGLALLRREKFDVVLMDIQMLGLDGLEATRLIRGDTSGMVNAKVPIVAITAHALHGDKERILKAGVDEYIAKPVYLEQLRSILSKILGVSLSVKQK